MIKFVVIHWHHGTTGREVAGARIGTIAFIMNIYAPFDGSSKQTALWYLRLQLLDPYEDTWTEGLLHAPKGLSLGFKDKFITSKGGLRTSEISDMLIKRIGLISNTPQWPFAQIIRRKELHIEIPQKIVDRLRRQGA